MHKLTTTLLTASALAAGLAVVPALYAQDSHGSGRPMMRDGMMGGRNMMGQSSQMMDHCSRMMGMMGGPGSGKPNEQWQQPAPKAPEKKG